MQVVYDGRYGVPLVLELVLHFHFCYANCKPPASYRTLLFNVLLGISDLAMFGIYSESN